MKNEKKSFEKDGHSFHKTTRGQVFVLLPCELTSNLGHVTLYFFTQQRWSLVSPAHSLHTLNSPSLSLLLGPAFSSIPSMSTSCEVLGCGDTLIVTLNLHSEVSFSFINRCLQSPWCKSWNLNDDFAVYLVENTLKSILLTLKLKQQKKSCMRVGRD